jgi:pimeloyl-ACP methyl ester carboxylesterase
MVQLSLREPNVFTHGKNERNGFRFHMVGKGRCRHGRNCRAIRRQFGASDGLRGDRQDLLSPRPPMRKFTLGWRRSQSPKRNLPMRFRRFTFAIVVLLLSQAGVAAVCDKPDDESKVSGVSQCLLMRRFGSSEPAVMVVWLHGDVSSGGPADYHFAAAQKAVQDLAADKILSVALVRPGYPDGSGESSGVGLLDSGRSDHYTKANVAEVGAAIGHLRDRFQPAFVIAVGHSGGAATAAILLGMKPGLVDAVVLVACPCDTVAWRVGRRAWRRSENPLAWVDRVDPTARVIALTGDRDDNTSPDLARAYVQALHARHVDATFRLLPDETHNGAFRSPEVLEALKALLPRR